MTTMTTEHFFAAFQEEAKALVNQKILSRDDAGAIASAFARIAADLATRSKSAWIPVGERLPDDDITVMIAMKDGDEPVWLGYYDGDGWVNVDAMPLRNTVTHWRPMPESPHG